VRKLVNERLFLLADLMNNLARLFIQTLPVPWELGMQGMQLHPIANFLQD